MSPPLEERRWAATPIWSGYSGGMICAFCGEETPTNPCGECGQSPLLNEQYRLSRVLGQGAVGTTYAAERLVDGRLVAVKEMPLRRAETDKARQLIEREVALLRQLDHPGIPTHDDDFMAGRGKHRALYLVQEYIDGTPLSEAIRSERLTEAEVLDILDALLPILGYLHSLRPPVIHRDIKPDNIMRRPDGALVLIDFGSARDAVKDPDLGGSTVAGTFGFMAPEQFAGDAMPATDLYALGMLAVVLLTRKEARGFQERASLEGWLKAASVSAPMQALIADLTAEAPADRPASAAAVQARIQAIRSPPRQALRPQPARPQPVPSVPRPVKSPPQTSLTEQSNLNVLWFAVLGLGVIVLLGLLGRTPSPPPAGGVETSEPRCGDAPCRPLAEGQLKGVTLGMSAPEVLSAFPDLASGEVPPDTVIPSRATLNIDDLLNRHQYSVSLPGTRYTISTSLLEQPAECDFQLAADDRVSRMSCTLTETSSSMSMHETFSLRLIMRLTEQYGSATQVNDDDSTSLSSIVSRDWGQKWWQDGDQLVVESTFSQVMDLPPTSTLSVTFTARQHTAVVTQHEQLAEKQYQEKKAQKERERAEAERQLLEQLKEDDLGSGDL